MEYYGQNDQKFKESLKLMLKTSPQESSYWQFFNEILKRLSKSKYSYESDEFEPVNLLELVSHKSWNSCDQIKYERPLEDVVKDHFLVICYYFYIFNVESEETYKYVENENDIDNFIKYFVFKRKIETKHQNRFTYLSKCKESH